MLREGLRAEIPQLPGLVARMRLPRVPLMSPALAAVSALGVSSLVSALVRTLSAASLYLGGVYPVRSQDGITVAADALAITFAFAAARWRGVLATALLLAVLEAERLWLGAPGQQTFCERTATPCDPFGNALAQLKPPALGLALGVAAAVAVHRWVRPGRSGVVALLLGLGIASLVSVAALLAIVPFVGRTPTGTPAAEAFNWVIGGQAAGAVALGLIIGVLGKRPLLGAIAVIIFYIGPWSPSLRDIGAPNRGFVLSIDWRLMIPVWYAAGAIIGIGGGVVVRRLRASVRKPDS